TATGTVRTVGNPLNAHSGSSTSFPVVSSIKNGASVNIDCTTTGITITGKFGTSNIWDHVPGGYVTDTYVYTGTGRAAAFPCGGSRKPSTSGCQYIGICDKIIACVYGRGYSGFPSASVHWQSTPTRYKHVGDRNAPAGALVFFQGGKDDYIAISTGGLNLISTDIGGTGTLTRSTIGTIESKWGHCLR
ncbi:hypothetical protein BGW39_003262, partial [Mortierella sp. 14UC]